MFHWKIVLWNRDAAVIRAIKWSSKSVFFFTKTDQINVERKERGGIGL